MKNKWFLIPGVLLVFGSVFVSCDTGTNGDSGGGKLTITGLGDINGKYLGATGSSSAVGLVGIGDRQKNTGVLVSGGKAELNIYKLVSVYKVAAITAAVITLML
jgi:hypothetical protein